MQESAVLKMLRHPVYLFIELDHARFNFLYIYEPTREGIVYKRCAAAITVRITVSVGRLCEQKLPLFQILDNYLICLFYILPLQEFRRVRVISTVGIQERHH